MNKIIDFYSKHFVVHSLSEGIYAAIASIGGHAICNAGLIDLGGQILVFDPFLTPQAASDLRRFASQELGRAPQLVINSHYHNDHIWGNQIFAAEAQIISSRQTRQLITTSGQEEFAWYSGNSTQQLQTLQAQYQSTADEAKRKEMLLWIGEYEGIVEALPNLSVCLPNITFDGHLDLYGTQHSCTLFSFDGGHTGSDTILYLPQEGIVFVADLLFVSGHPYLGDGDPDMLLKALKDLSCLEASCFVPGHGPLGTLADVMLLIEYIEDCMDCAKRLCNSGDTSEAAIKGLKIPERFQAWQIAQFYPMNIKFLCQRLGPTRIEQQVSR